jgi:nicotinate phosphoribosyltransferase
VPVFDFGLRSSHGVDSGMKLARACRIAGLAGTSNVAGAHHFGLAASGTMAHSFVQAHLHEQDAFEDFVDAYPGGTTLLVDTYDVRGGIERAIAVARARPSTVRGIRIDSGDLAALSVYARCRLDEEGLTDVQVVVSGGLDEWEIERLRAADVPIGGFGVGRALAVSMDAPTVDAVYKLVAVDGRGVRKTSPGKETWPGPKQVWRAEDWSGDILGLADEAGPWLGCGRGATVRSAMGAAPSCEPRSHRPAAVEGRCFGSVAGADFVKSPVRSSFCQCNRVPSTAVTVAWMITR